MKSFLAIVNQRTGVYTLRTEPHWAPLTPTKPPLSPNEPHLSPLSSDDTPLSAIDLAMTPTEPQWLIMAPCFATKTPLGPKLP